MQNALNNSDTIPFSNMSAYKFEQLCCELISQEEQIAFTEIYGRNGQKDYGVDIVALKKGDSEIIAIQCKCWTYCSDAKIKKSSNEFIKHIDKWMNFKTTRFILCVACEINEVKAIDTFIEQRIKFEQQNIEYEIWAARTIQSKLSKHPLLATKFIDNQYWFDLIIKGKSDSSIVVHDLFSKAGKNIINNLNNSYFNDILKVISDLNSSETKNAMLEKLVSITDQICGKNKPTPIQSVEIVKKLAENNLNLNIWELRRSFGNALGVMTSELFSFNSRRDSQFFFEFVEYFLDSPNRRILLAQIATASFQSARNIKLENILKLLNDKHPQVKWQLMKGWHFVAPVIKEKKAAKSILDFTDIWIRRRFLNTIIVNVGRDNSAYKSWQGVVKDLLQLEIQRDAKDGYLTSLVAWINRNTLIDLKNIAIDKQRSYPLDLSISIRNFSAKGTENEIEELISSINLSCISLDSDVLNLEKVSPIRKSLLGNEGRYGIIKEWVDAIIHNSSLNNLAVVLQKLTECHDEGVRWAIAKLARKWVIHLSDKDRFKLFNHLVNDAHP